MAHVCPWWYAYFFDNWFRRILYKPERLFGRYVREGMTVLDIGCGMGYNAIALARMVGERGRVIATDVQEKMLDVLRRRAERAGVARRIETRQSRPDSMGIDTEVDFAVAFWVVHEVPDAARLMEEVRSCLAPDAKFVVVEPQGYVSAESFREMLDVAEKAGLRVWDEPRIPFSRSAVLHRG
jgi:ubiquinone/menaquinone biosynthesis C-methylase UbiE